MASLWLLSLQPLCCDKVDALISHCAFRVEKSAALMPAVGWWTSTQHSTVCCGLHICRTGVHCRIPLRCRSIRDFLTKSNQVATSLRDPLHLSCQKDVENQGWSSFPSKRKEIYKQASMRLRGPQRIPCFSWSALLEIGIQTSPFT